MITDSENNALRNAHLLECKARLGRFIRRLDRGREAIDKSSTLSLRHFVSQVKDASPWHSDRLSAFKVEDIDIHNLGMLPTMSKEDLMTNWDSIVTVPRANLAEAMTSIATMTDQSYIWGNNTLFSSGGSSGRPGVFLYSWEGVLTNWMGMTRSTVVPFFSKYRGDPGDVRISYIGAGMSAHGSYILGRIFSNPDKPTKQYSLWQAPEVIINGLNEDQPHVLYASGSILPVLCEAAQNGKLNISPILVFSAGEYLSSSHRDLARRTWHNASVLSCWGSSEGAGTFPCPTGDGFHISEDLVIIEPDGDLVKTDRGTGISSGIILTNLYNIAMPIIRMKIDDCFEFDANPCVCGSQYRKIVQVHGRSYESFRFGNLTIHPAALELSILHKQNILEYQIRQIPDGISVLVVTKDLALDVSQVEREMTQELDKMGVKAIGVSCKVVDRIERTSTGKLRRFVPL